jgi:hypothetical protein
MAFARKLPGAWHFANLKDFPAQVLTSWARCAEHGSSTTVSAVPPAGPSHSTVVAYATRTYIVVPGFGKQRFRLLNQRQTVTAADGSTISAFPIENDYGGTADSVSWTVMFFRDGSFIGWAGSRAAGSATIFGPASGDAIRVAYPKPNQPTCCQSEVVWVSYTWNGSRIVASAEQPSGSYALQLAPA